MKNRGAARPVYPSTLSRFHIKQPALIEMERVGMENAVEKGSLIKFGQVPLTASVDAFRHAMNAEIMAFLHSLPKSKQTDAVVFLLKHCRTSFLPRFDFFANYYSPAWSVIYWLEKTDSNGASLKSKEIAYARTAHAMALFLHPLDDHLADGQLPASHFHILLRSQAWSRMTTAFDHLSREVPDGGEIVRSYIDDYYASIESPPRVDSLDGYCRHFVKQMATGMIVPALMAAKISSEYEFAPALEEAYGAFGIAWRLLDDLRDMAVDMATGSHSAIYFGMSAEARQLWDQVSKDNNSIAYKKIRSVVFDSGIWETVVERIATELTSAATLLDAIELEGLAEELRCLAEPFSIRREES